MVFKTIKVPKVPVEQLQEQYLTGPAQEPIEQIAEEMKEDQVVVSPKVPPHEWVVFRNQRDPGHPLEFHAHTRDNPFKMYKLIDGHKYYLPREIIANLESCRENIEKYHRNSEGLPTIQVTGYKSHFVCERA